MEEQPELLDIDALRRWLNISRPQVFKLMREKGLPRVKMGARTLRFERDKIERWLQEQQQSA